MSIEVRHATQSELPELAKGIAQAFQNDPHSRWLLPDDATRPVVQERANLLFLTWALDAGRVNTTADLGGVAIWMPDNVVPPPAHDEQIRDILGSDANLRYEQVADVARPFYPHYLRHDYLDCVAAFETGRGIGTALLQHHLRELDETDRYGYLVASTPDSARLYGRLGFSATGQFSFPKGPLAYPMLYRPRQGPWL